MPKYRAIIEDVQVYAFLVDVPEGLTEDQVEDHILNYLSENRDTCWRSGEENIVVVEKIHT